MTVARTRIAYRRISNQRSLCERAEAPGQTPDGHLRSDHWHMADGCNENIPAQLVFESRMVYIDFFRRGQCQSPILGRRPSMPC